MTPGKPAASPSPRAGGPVLSREVLERVKARDAQALNDLFEAYFNRVYGLAHRLLGDTEAAEDATQDVFVKIYGAAHRLDPSRDPGPWITTITYNACRDVWRSRRHRMDRLTSSIDEHPGLVDAASHRDSDGVPEIARKEREELVQEAILKLPEPLRAVVLLHDYQGMSHDQIAGVVGASHAAVRKRYSRALSRLGELLRGVLA